MLLYNFVIYHGCLEMLYIIMLLPGGQQQVHFLPSCLQPTLCCPLCLFHVQQDLCITRQGNSKAITSRMTISIPSFPPPPPCPPSLNQSCSLQEETCGASKLTQHYQALILSKEKGKIFSFKTSIQLKTLFEQYRLASSGKGL